MSSYGGFALIKSKIFNNVEWSADIHCDHVNMCYDISRYGNIYCDPKNKVYVDVDSNDIDVDRSQKIGQQQLQQYKMFF
jgi:hypothetical protein